MTNREFAQQDEKFREACKRAGIPPTSRQASRWRMKNGKAWNEGRAPQTDDSIVDLKQAS